LPKFYIARPITTSQLNTPAGGALASHTSILSGEANNLNLKIIPLESPEVVPKLPLEIKLPPTSSSYSLWESIGLPLPHDTLRKRLL
jgi:hypothetical protein